jgi:hypothetical protein
MPKTRATPRMRSPLFDDLPLESLDKRNNVMSLGFGYLKLRQGCCGMTEEHVPGIL